MPAGFLPSTTHLLQWLCFLKLILAVHRKAYTLSIVRSPGCLKVTEGFFSGCMASGLCGCL